MVHIVIAANKLLLTLRICLAHVQFLLHGLHRGHVGVTYVSAAEASTTSHELVSAIISVRELLE